MKTRIKENLFQFSTSKNNQEYVCLGRRLYGCATDPNDEVIKAGSKHTTYMTTQNGSWQLFPKRRKNG